MSDGGELIYASWGGQGHSSALRTAVQRASETGQRLTYLAILDEDTFGEIDAALADSVATELQWLLEAQLRLVLNEAGIGQLDTRAVVEQGDVRHEIEHFIDATGATEVLFGAVTTDVVTVDDVRSFATEIEQATKATVNIVTL